MIIFFQYVILSNDFYIISNSSCFCPPKTRGSVMIGVQKYHTETCRDIYNDTLQFLFVNALISYISYIGSGHATTQKIYLSLEEEMCSLNVNTHTSYCYWLVIIWLAMNLFIPTAVNQCGTMGKIKLT